MKYLLYASACLLVLGCVSPQDTAFTKLPPGVWRGVLLLDNEPVIATLEDEEVSMKVDRQGELPFTFEVIYTDEQTFYIEVINGDERIRVDDITYGTDRATAKDTIIINFPIYDTYIKAIYEEDVMEGYWYVNYKDRYSIPFKAYFGKNHRFFTTKPEPAADLSGRWAATFEVGTKDQYPAVGELVQDGNQLSGTFLTETGDYRYLDGTVHGNKVYLSTFDGSHAFLFLGKILEDGSLTGVFRSGSQYVTDWVAVRDSTAALADPLTLTSAMTREPIDFSFVNADGDLVSLTDDAYEGKIKIIDIMGTWCPNCKDASDYLKNYMKTAPPDVAVIALAFERYADPATSLEVIKRYKEAAGIPWEVLLAGSYRKSEASETLPQLSKILSYPTLVVLDKDNIIRYIHTGFNGPATSQYDEFDRTFRSLVSSLGTTQ